MKNVKALDLIFELHARHEQLESICVTLSENVENEHLSENNQLSLLNIAFDLLNKIGDKETGLLRLLEDTIDQGPYLAAESTEGAA